MGIGSIIGFFGSLLVGGTVAVVTIVGVVHSQTTPSGPSPANANQPTVVYGSGS